MNLIEGPLIPYYSAGDIKIGHSIDEYLNYFLARNVYPVEYHLPNQSTVYQITLNDYLSVAYKEDQLVYAITVYPKFEGNYMGKISPNMTLKELKELKIKIFYFSNSLYFLNNFGLKVNLPDEFDDCDSLFEVPDETLINSITIANFDNIKSMLPKTFFKT